MKICFTGDVFLGGDLLSYKESIITSDTYLDADFRVINLEQATGVSDNNLEEKSTIHAPNESLDKLQGLNANIVALSNNHIHDLKDYGIKNSLNELRNRKIPFFGAGNDLEEARKVLWISEDIGVLGYCEFNKPYLKKTKPASTTSSGVNPLNYDNIIEDLEALPKGKKVILHFHWGREHVILPDYELILFAKKLLKDNRVVCVIGMHAHRIQGVINYNGKKAYMCLGNFLFPNFYIRPKTHVCYPESPTPSVLTTKDYHFVGKLTYKKWRYKNRLSIIVLYNTETNRIEHVPVLMDKNKPTVRELKGLQKQIVNFKIALYSLLYTIPKSFYIPLQKLNVITNKLIRYAYIYMFLVRQNGFKWTFRMALKYLKK